MGTGWDGKSFFISIDVDAIFDVWMISIVTVQWNNKAIACEQYILLFIHLILLIIKKIKIMINKTSHRNIYVNQTNI